jgi:DNA modification methylase
MAYTVHPAAEFFPLLPADELQALADDIKANGLRESIKLFAGQILDGRNRYRACELAGVEPHFETIPDHHDPYDCAYAWNALRRHLAPGQRVIIKGLMLDASAQWRRLRQEKASAALQPRNAQGHFGPMVSNDANGQGRTREILAELADTSPATAERALTLIDRRPDLAAQVQWGRQSLNAALQQMRREAVPVSAVVPTTRQAGLFLCVAAAERLPLPDASVDVIITSPPYNIGPKAGVQEHREDGYWRTGGRAWGGIEGETVLPEAQYQAWQLQVLLELFRVARPGASLFYNHKVRQRDGAMIHPMAWLLQADGWTLRQEIIWDRKSTHNHELTYFWPHDERIYWLTKGRPHLPASGIGQSTVWSFPFEPDTWHVSPFPEELPRRCLTAVGIAGKVVLDPFGGRMTVCKVALSLGAERVIGCDINPQHLIRACAEHRWR